MALRYVLPLTLAVLAIAAGPAQAAPGSPPKQGKEYSMSLMPATTTAGVTYDSPIDDGSESDYEITLRNETGTQQLGSANVTVPLGITVTDRNGNGGSDRKIELRNLAIPAGTSKTVRVGLRMPCAATTDAITYQWDVDAKQSNDYSGTGNTLAYSGTKPSTTVVGTCKLRFVTQPADAEIDHPISTLPFTAPSATNVISVEAVDGRLSPTALTWFNGKVRVTSSSLANPLTYSSTVDATSGLARFFDLSIPISGTYALVPTAPFEDGFTGSASGTFQVVDVTAACDSRSCAVPPLKGTKTEASTSGSNVTGDGLAVLSLGLGLDPLGSLGCRGYTPPDSSPDYYEFRLFNAEADTMVVLEYPAAKKWSALEVCFAAPGPQFHAKDGTLAPAFDYDGPGTGGYAALLPSCPPAPRTEPCVTGRGRSASGGAQITFWVPRAWSGDPRWH